MKTLMVLISVISLNVSVIEIALATDMTPGASERKIIKLLPKTEVLDYLKSHGVTLNDNKVWPEFADIKKRLNTKDIPVNIQASYGFYRASANGEINGTTNSTSRDSDRGIIEVNEKLGKAVERFYGTNPANLLKPGHLEDNTTGRSASGNIVNDTKPQAY